MLYTTIHHIKHTHPTFVSHTYLHVALRPTKDHSRLSSIYTHTQFSERESTEYTQTLHAYMHIPLSQV